MKGKVKRQHEKTEKNILIMKDPIGQLPQLVKGMGEKKKSSRSNERGKPILKTDFKDTASENLSQKKSTLKRHGTMKGN